RLDGHVGSGTGRDVTDDAELDRLGLGGPRSISNPNRVPVHRRVGPRRQGDTSTDALGGHAPERIGRDDGFGADWFGRCEYRIPGRFDAEQPGGRWRAHEPGSGTAARSGPEATALYLAARRPATTA